MNQRDPAAWPADFGQGRFDQRPGLHLVYSTQPEAAHAASEFDADDEDAREPMTDADKSALLVIALVSACTVAGAVLVIWSKVML